MSRSPYDGKPYYCKICGLGFNEYIACEELDCELESEASAKLRFKASKAITFKTKLAKDLEIGDSVYDDNNGLRIVKSIEFSSAVYLKGDTNKRRFAFITWDDKTTTVVDREFKCTMYNGE